MEEPRVLVGPGTEQPQDLGPDALGVEAWTHAGLERDQEADRRSRDDRSLGPEHAQVVEVRLELGPSIVRGDARHREVDDGRDHGPGARPRALSHRALDERVVGDSRGVVGRQDGAARLDRERLGRVAADDVERSRVGAPDRRHRVADGDAVDDRPGRRDTVAVRVLLQQPERVRGDVPAVPPPTS